MVLDHQFVGSRRLSVQESWAEDERLLALQSLHILDTPPEPAFEQIVGITRRLFKVPMVAVSLIDRDRQWFKARCGIEVSETERSVSFCTHAIASSDAVFCVPDATRDALFADNPLVTGAPHIRFYAGAVLRAPEGAPIGTLCIINSRPRPALGEEDRQALQDLAALASDELALRATARALEVELKKIERTRLQLETANAALKRMNDRHRRDLEAAAAIQRGNLPPALLTLPGLTIAGLHVPSQELSGDMFGYGRFDETSSFFWIGDIAGHGTEAALRSMTLSKIIANNMKPGGGYSPPKDPVAFLDQINRMMLWPDESSSYFTLLYGLIEDDAEAVRLAFAGAPAPLVLRAGAEPELIEGSGLPLGLFAEVTHEEVVVPLSRGARLLVYSDGLVDNRDEAGRPFGEQRLADWLVATRNRPAARALGALDGLLLDWSGGRSPDDDMAAILIERN